MPPQMADIRIANTAQCLRCTRHRTEGFISVDPVSYTTCLGTSGPPDHLPSPSIIRAAFLQSFPPLHPHLDPARASLGVPRCATYSHTFICIQVSPTCRSFNTHPGGSYSPFKLLKQHCSGMLLRPHGAAQASCCSEPHITPGPAST